MSSAVLPFPRPPVPAIEARGLCLAAGTGPARVPVLHQADLTVRRGERVALVGPNGAGKSTLLQALAARAALAAGSLQVLGRELSAPWASRQALRQFRRDVAWVQQGLHLQGRLSALDNVLIGGAARQHGPAAWIGRWPSDERDAAALALARVGLGGFARRRADSLSGGERQKLALARALHQRAPLMLADEPTAALDTRASRQVAELLAGLSVESGQTLICVLHDPSLVPVVAERVLLLREGRLHEEPPSGLLPQRPRQTLHPWPQR